MLHRRVRRVMVLARVLVGWLVLTLVASNQAGAGWVAAVAVGAAAAILSWGSAWRIFALIDTSTLLRGFVRGVPLAAGILLGGLAVSMRSDGWVRFAGVVIIAVSAQAAVDAATMLPVSVTFGYLWRRLWRTHTKEDIVDDILYLLRQVADTSQRNDLDARREWIAGLERIAQRIEGSTAGSVGRFSMPTVVSG